MSAAYRIEIARRSLAGYTAAPWLATAWRIRDETLIAFARALRYVREDQEREPVAVMVAGGEAVAHTGQDEQP